MFSRDLEVDQSISSLLIRTQGEIKIINSKLHSASHKGAIVKLFFNTTWMDIYFMKINCQH